MPNWTFGGFLAKALGVILLVLAGVLGVIIWRVLWGSYSTDDVSRFQSFAVSMLLPMFQAVLTVLVGAGIIKGALTAFNNRHLPEANRQQIKFFVW